MDITECVAYFLENVRKSGQHPVLIAVSPDRYTLWERQSGAEPCSVWGVPIRIRDNFMPKTILVIGHRDAENPELEARYNKKGKNYD